MMVWYTCCFSTFTCYLHYKPIFAVHRKTQEIVIVGRHPTCNIVLILQIPSSNPFRPFFPKALLPIVSTTVATTLPQRNMVLSTALPIFHQNHISNSSNFKHDMPAKELAETLNLNIMKVKMSRKQ
ncbi:hypothetical protein DVH24_031222 [Malus domestica]|uniref:Uncharacterized protein n=1 Tax=Malus domestica TaxID=3750 RepID=A0A498HCW8_MALDO|nr:hypothetical protein DVH24_031222 [Malus domestica]